MRLSKKFVLQILTLCLLATGFAAMESRAASRKRSSGRTETPDPRFAFWEQLTSPKEGPPRIYGGYARGCIAGAVQMPLDGDGYAVINLEQKRYFGHPTLVRYLQNLGATLKIRKSPPLLIEDMSAPRGGPFSRGHQSHQNGLDVDISYSMPKILLTMGQRAKRQEISFVGPKQELLPNWTLDQTRLIFYAANSPEVNRVFVAPAVKKYFCEKFPAVAWQHKLRPIGHHEDHLHVRLECPSDQPECVKQPLNPEDTACGASLENWIRRETEPVLADGQPAAPKLPTPGYQRFPSIPAVCMDVRK